MKCSNQYWEDIEPIFSNLEKEKELGTKWKDLPSKWDDVYEPLLQAFLDELNRSYKIHGNIIPSKMVEYLLGHFDFYKVIGIDSKKVTEIQTFNLRGTLNKSSKQQKPEITIPTSNLPSRIICADFKPDHKNVIEVFFDAGWQFKFRIHNASSKVETSLKFDIEIIGMPTTIIVMKCRWR
nr:HaeIII family restriction endonuclease [Methanobrevibacter arboriphilus]